MNKNKQLGFSIVELLLVLVIVGILATITFPFLFQAKAKAENGNAFASLRTISSAQVGYFSNHQRFARLTELNAAQANGLGITVGNDLVRGKFTFQMSPATVTDAQLRETYTIIATKSVGGNELPYVISLTQTGEITQILP